MSAGLVWKGERSGAAERNREASTLLDGDAEGADAVRDSLQRVICTPRRVPYVTAGLSRPTDALPPQLSSSDAHWRPACVDEG
jgi:hypothetical protein